MRDEKIHRAVKQLMRTDRMHRSVIDQKVGKMGIHRSQHMMLMHLSRLQQTPSQIELCRHFDISAPAVAGTLKKLEKESYIFRKPAESDNRVNEISITEKGRKMVEQTRSLFEDIEKIMMRNISEKELDELNNILEKIQKNLEEGRMI